MSVDAMAGSIHHPKSLNRYGYSGGDAVNRVDPLGLCSGDTTIPPVNEDTRQQRRCKACQNRVFAACLALAKAQTCYKDADKQFFKALKACRIYPKDSDERHQCNRAADTIHIAAIQTCDKIFADCWDIVGNALQRHM